MLTPAVGIHFSESGLYLTDLTNGYGSCNLFFLGPYCKFNIVTKVHSLQQPGILSYHLSLYIDVMLHSTNRRHPCS